MTTNDNHIIPTNIVNDWYPMWAGRAHTERPWWQAVGEWTNIYYRRDGWRVELVNGVVYANPPGRKYVHLDGITTIEGAMAHIDTMHPLPPPRPMPGQVWVSKGGTECMIAAAWRDGDSWWVQWASNPVVPVLWEAPTSILVAGPTPWGHNIPWAPMGEVKP